MKVKCISDYYTIEPRFGEVYEVEAEVKGMYIIRDSEGEAYAYPVSMFEVVEAETSAEETAS